MPIEPTKLFELICNEVTAKAPAPIHAENCLRFLKIIQPSLMNAPASSKVAYHHAYRGGLLYHIWEMYQIALEIRNIFPATPQYMDLNDWNKFLVALLHDLHKACDWEGRPFYEPNILKNGTQSDKVPFEKSASCFSFVGLSNCAATEPSRPFMNAAELLLARNLDLIPQGDLSLALVRALAPAFYDNLPEPVKFAVRHHDGMYGAARREIMAGNETPLMLVMHFADMVSSRRERWLKPTSAE